MVYQILFLVEVSNGAKVSMKGFTISGPETLGCGNTPINGLIGVSIQEGATLNIDSSLIQDCTFVAFGVGAPFFFPNGEEVGHAIITNTDITNYRAVGIIAQTFGSTLTITKSNIIVAADTSRIPGQVEIFIAGQGIKVGILVELGAKAIIDHNKFSGNICNDPVCGPDFFTQFQAFGIIVESAPGSIVSYNYVSNNDVGIGVFGTSGCCLAEYNKLIDNRFFGIIIGDGEHTISNTKIFVGKVGAAAIAGTAAIAFFEANTTATLDRVKIVDTEIPIQAHSTGNLTAAVNVFSPSFFLP